MLVKERLAALRDCDPNAMVYSPSNRDGVNAPVKYVADCPHIDLPVKGIKITDDVALLPDTLPQVVEADE